MAKVTGPLFSLKATKAFKKVIIYQGKKALNLVFGFHKPGSKTPFTPSESQITQRLAIKALVEAWQELSDATKELWENWAQDIGYVGTGYHLYIHKKGLGIIPPEPPAEEYLLQEIGDFLLLEDGGKIILE